MNITCWEFFICCHPNRPLKHLWQAVLTQTLVFSSNNTKKNAVASSHMKWSHRPEKLQGLFIHCYKEQIFGTGHQKRTPDSESQEEKGAKHQGGTSHPSMVIKFPCLQLLLALHRVLLVLALYLALLWHAGNVSLSFPDLGFSPGAGRLMYPATSGPLSVPSICDVLRSHRTART